MVASIIVFGFLTVGDVGALVGAGIEVGTEVELDETEEFPELEDTLFAPPEDEPEAGCVGCAGAQEASAKAVALTSVSTIKGIRESLLISFSLLRIYTKGYSDFPGTNHHLGFLICAGRDYRGSISFQGDIIASYSHHLVKSLYSDKV